MLFLCVHNSARSQMAEAYLKTLGGKKFDVESAGLEAGKLNPIAVEAMKEEEIDISKNKTKNVNLFLEQGKRYDYVITVCDESSAAQCPVFPGTHGRLHWSFGDPSSFSGTAQQKLHKTKIIRDEIKTAVKKFIEACDKC